MIDIYEIRDNDIKFKNHQSLKIRGLTVPQKTYAYDEKIGIDIEFWIKSDILYDFDSFKTYYVDFLKQYGVSLEEIDFSLINEGINNLNITLYPIEEV